VAPDAFVRPESAEPYARDDRLPWVTGEHLGTGEVASLPAEFVHFPPPENRYRPAITTGLGLGNSGPHAALSGLYEAIERDATMTSWYSTADPLGIEVDDEGFAELEKRARTESLSVTPLLVVTTDIDVPVVAVGVHREGDWPASRRGRAPTSIPPPRPGARFAEALQNWTELRSMGPDAAAKQGAAIGRHADFPAETRAFFDADATVPAESLGEPELSGGDELAAVVDRAEAGRTGAVRRADDDPRPRRARLRGGPRARSRRAAAVHRRPVLRRPRPRRAPIDGVRARLGEGVPPVPLRRSSTLPRLPHPRFKPLPTPHSPMDVLPDADVEAVEAVDGVFLTQGAAGETSIQRFVIDPGAEVPEHDHPHEQVGVITEGTITFVVDGEDRVVEAGDTYVIPGSERTRRATTATRKSSATTSSPPRANPDWQE